MHEKPWAKEYSEVIRLISHDLRNPLSTVQLNAQLIERAARSEGREREQRLASVIASATRRIDGMIQQLVDAERMRSGQLKLTFESVRLDELLREWLAQGAETDARRFDCSKAQAAIAVTADRRRLGQVLDTMLRIAAQEADGDCPISVELVSREGQAMLSITTPTAQSGQAHAAGATPVGRGHGIALHVARTAVECHRGRLETRDSPDGALALALTLPHEQPVYGGT